MSVTARVAWVNVLIIVLLVSNSRAVIYRENCTRFPDSTRVPVYIIASDCPGLCNTSVTNVSQSTALLGITDTNTYWLFLCKNNSVPDIDTLTDEKLYFDPVNGRIEKRLTNEDCPFNINQSDPVETIYDNYECNNVFLELASPPVSMAITSVLDETNSTENTTLNELATELVNTTELPSITAKETTESKLIATIIVVFVGISFVVALYLVAKTATK